MLNRYPNLPLAQPKPNAAEFIGILTGTIKNARTPLIEYNVDGSVVKPIVTEMLGRQWVEPGKDRESQTAFFENIIEFWYRLGYDFVRFECPLHFPERSLLTGDTAPGVTGNRAWVDEHQGTITNWEEFESYPWPKVGEFDFFAFEYLSGHLREGMGFMTCHAGGPFEHLSQIMSLEGLCIALSEQPDLVQAVADKLGGLMLEFYQHLVQLPNLIAIFPGDDMGYRTSTMISPAALRKYTLPWHKRFAALAHEHGAKYFLHSCGMLEAIMDDLINDIQIDGKHSYEDVIIPVDQFHARYGNRIAVLGGVDVHLLSTGAPEDIRRRVRYLIDTCGRHGRYAVGSGNSIPSYVSAESYLTMVDEVLAPM